MLQVVYPGGLVFIPSGGSVDLTSPGPIGGTTPNTVAATTLSVPVSGSISIGSTGLNLSGFSFPSNEIDFWSYGTRYMSLRGSNLYLGSGTLFGWSSNADPQGAVADTVLARAASNTLVLRNSTAAQTFGMGPATTDGVLLKQASGVLSAKLGDDSAFAGLACGAFTASGAVTITSGTISGVPITQNSKSAAYTTVLADSGKHIFHPSADTTARTFTIDSNANVAYPVGTTLTFVNQSSAGVLTIAITADTMRLAGAGTTGSRTLAANGIATALKVTSTEWLINGTGLT